MPSPIHTRRNLYRGINAHLHSRLQVEGGWHSFHTNHISDLARIYNETLLPFGYRAEVEDALQVRRVGDCSVPHLTHRQWGWFGQPSVGAGLCPRPRITGDHTGSPLHHPHLPYIPPLRLFSGHSSHSISEKTLKAVAIYAVTPTSGTPDTPVAWTELLSPSNKPHGRDFETYRAKREQLLETGLVFIEIDYLHHTPPTFPVLADYTATPIPSDAQPYRIVVIDPRPDFYAGQSRTQQFAVDEAIPTMNIPLNAGDNAEIDFGAAYTKTFTEMFYGQRVDYGTLPQAFERYSEADRARIANRVLAVQEASRRGDDLEATILEPGDLPLNVALRRLGTE